MDKPVTTNKDIFLTVPEISLFLEKYFSYYTSLNSFWKKIFCERVEYFTKTKNFVGGGGFVPNNQVKAIISASAVQLTLGLEVWDLHYFDTIIIFPTDFLNQQSGLKLKGETNLAGFVSLSWKSFIQGYRIRDDNLNLGIHEFTHALRFNGIKNENTDYFFSNYFAKWYCIGRKEFSNLSQNKPSIFRAYGGSNVNEFLSVVVEHFFESPQQFKTELPLLYSATAILLNQKHENTFTKVNVRKEELNSHPVFSPLPTIDTNVSFFKSTSAYIGLIFLSLGVFTVAKAGILAFPTLFLFFIGLMNLIMSDYKYTKGTIESNKIHISKGFLLFKNRRRFMIQFQHLMSADFFSESRNDETVMLTFLNNDDYFYEETVHLKINELQKQYLTDGLRKNFVWVKFSL